MWAAQQLFQFFSSFLVVYLGSYRPYCHEKSKVVENTSPVQARFLWFSAEMPAILFLFLMAVGGFALGVLVMVFIGSDTKSK